jgi:hypothetical protein
VVNDSLTLAGIPSEVLGRDVLAAVRDRDPMRVERVSAF